MKSWIWALAVILTGILASTGLTGCDGDDDGGETQTVTVTNEVGEVVVVEVPVDDSDGDGGTTGTNAGASTGNTNGTGATAEEDVPVAERPALEAPSLVSPAHNSSIANPEGGTIDVAFSWTGVENASYYVIQASTSGGSREAQVAGTSHTFNIPNGTWRWQVAAVNGELIEWSDTRIFFISSGWVPTDP